MAVYKVSYVVIGSNYPGAILNKKQAPAVGDSIVLGDETFKVIEVLELMPARGEFHYMHATCQMMNDSRRANP